MNQKITIVIGLPGCGKSTLLETYHKESPGTVFDDFHAFANRDSEEFCESRYYDALREKLASGCNCAIADIAYCRAERLQRAEREIRSLANELGIDLTIEHLYFSNDPGACRHNVVHRFSQDGKRPYLRELETIEELTQVYHPPANCFPVETCCIAKNGNAVS